MKFLIIQFVFFSFFYYVFEAFFNRITMGAIIEKSLKKNQVGLWAYASIWMLPFGGVVAVIMSLFFMIPIFNNINFLPLLMLIGCIVITVIEYFGGLLLNKKLNLGIWDYSNTKIIIFGKTIPLNLNGQIDIWHSIGWFFITLPIYYFTKIIFWLAR
jgi:uncharacterized membrane protein